MFWDASMKQVKIYLQYTPEVNIYERYHFCPLLLCLVAKPCPTLCDPMDYVACQAPLSMGFPRQEHWSRLPFPSLGDLLDPGIEEMHLLHCQADSLLSRQGSPLCFVNVFKN